MFCDLSNNKDRYLEFCKKNYVPIYSKPWWLDAICEPNNWNVWLYEQGKEIVAAMPFYLENRKYGKYITKAPLTQNNGIIFKHPKGAASSTIANFEEKVIDSATEFIDSLGLAVYEQQYQYSFTNWLPFYWNGFQAIPRYTFVIEETDDIDLLWKNLSSSCRNLVKRGERNSVIKEDISPELFYDEHAKVFERQSLPVPFSRELWMRLYESAKKNDAGEVLCATIGERVASVLFLVWDEQSMYHLLGGTMPGFNEFETYRFLTWYAIKMAHKMGLKYDFEGSMIKRIAKSFRGFGGTPKLYFRIRKVFSPEVIRLETQKQIDTLALS